MYCPLNWPTFLRLAQPVNGFYANFRAFSRLFMGKGRQEGVQWAGQGANWGLHEADVGQNLAGNGFRAGQGASRGLPEAGIDQNTEGLAWAPNFAGWLADVFF